MYTCYYIYNVILYSEIQYVIHIHKKIHIQYTTTTLSMPSFLAHAKSARSGSRKLTAKV